MPTEQNQSDLDRSREVLKTFFEFARNQEGPSAQRTQVLHTLVALLAQEIVRLENQAQKDEQLWAGACAQEREAGYSEGYADGRRRLREV